MTLKTLKTTRRTSPRPDSLTTPCQVCLLPLMDAAVQFSLMSALAVVASKTRPPIVTLDVNGTTDGHLVTASYQLDGVLSGVGLLGGKTSQTTSILNNGGQSGVLSERVGRSTSSLGFTLQGGTLTLAGRLGRVLTRLEFERLMDGPRVQGFVGRGTLGSDPYSIDARLFGLERKNVAGRPSHLEGQLHVRGTVGDQAIYKLYDVASMGLAHGEELSLFGEGRVGDHQQRWPSP